MRLAHEWSSRAEDTYNTYKDKMGSSAIHIEIVKAFVMAVISIALSLQDIREELYEMNNG